MQQSSIRPNAVRLPSSEEIRQLDALPHRGITDADGCRVYGNFGAERLLDAAVMGWLVREPGGTYRRRRHLKAAPLVSHRKAKSPLAGKPLTVSHFTAFERQELER